MIKYVMHKLKMLTQQSVTLTVFSKLLADFHGYIHVSHESSLPYWSSIWKNDNRDKGTSGKLRRESSLTHTNPNPRCDPI